MLRDDKGKEMPAMTVFSESIKFLKHHFLDSCSDRQYGLEENEIHWVLTVPAIWDDTAKQFMREAAIMVCRYNYLYCSFPKDIDFRPSNTNACDMKAV